MALHRQRTIVNTYSALIVDLLFSDSLWRDCCTSQTSTAGNVFLAVVAHLTLYHLRK